MEVKPQQENRRQPDPTGDMPVGFAMALAQNRPAMERFSALSDAGKKGMLNRARLVTSKDEMDHLIASLAAAPLTGRTADGKEDI